MEQVGFKRSEIFSANKSVEIADGAVVSKIVIKNPSGNVTLFAFDKGQFLSEHSAPFDALIQIIEGEAKVTINKVDYNLKTGESIIMPANIPHAVFAISPFKMQLIMIKG